MGQCVLHRRNLKNQNIKQNINKNNNKTKACWPAVPNIMYIMEPGTNSHLYREKFQIIFFYQNSEKKPETLM